MDKTVECLRVEQVSKIIKKRTIIDEVSLTVNRGDIFGLVGENGAGKTTLMRLITGLIKPSKGNIFINQVNVCEDVNLLSSIGAIIEGPDLYKQLSGFRNLKIMANMYENIGNERIMEVASLLGIKERLGDKVKTYSLGMRQRLAIAITLLNHPKLLIFDEPLNGLDPQGVRELRTIMKELVEKEGVTIIISSHILSELELICNQFCIIKNGKVVEVQNIDISESANQQYEFHFFEDCNLVEMEGLLKSYKTDIISMDPKKVVLKVEAEEKIKIMKMMLEHNYQIDSIIPIKRSLEDYFIERVGEKK